MDQTVFDRRTFLELGGKAALAGVAANITVLRPEFSPAQTGSSSNDKIRFALIGAGVRGSQLLQASLRVPNVECVAVSDLWDARLQGAQEYAGKPLFTTKNFQEVLQRKDVDAVIVAVTDHQHCRVVTAACSAGKDVYCEKPMSHTVEQGFEMVEAAQKNKRVLQVGSQRVSSILYAKAREIYASGALGDVFAIDAYTDRDTASGAWVYPIPPDANEQTIDWNTFLIGAPRIPFDAARFFRWRGYRSYGEGLPGDLYVHLLSGIFFIANINEVPTRAYSTGGLFRWKNAGRDQPDVIATLYDFPNVRVSVHCNSNSNAGEMTSFYGTKGTLQINDSKMTFTPYVATPGPETYSTIGWPAKLRNEYLAHWYAEHPRPDVSAYKVEEGETFAAPAHYDEVVDHEAHFFHSVRTRESPVENEVFGNHTAIACHMANESYFNQNVAVWDAAARKIKT